MKHEIDRNSEEYIQISDIYRWNKYTIRWYKLFYLVLFDRKFRSYFKDIIFYALRWHDYFRGTGASDVFLFKSYYEDKIIKELKEL